MNFNEAMYIFNRSLDSLIERENGASSEEVAEAVYDLIRFRDEFFQPLVNESNERVRTATRMLEQLRGLAR
jgi:hypothetical protein